MNVTAYSRNKFLQTMEYWKVPREFAEPMFNYLVHGYSPGSCFTSVLANDFYGAIQRSHPANTVEAFKALAGWIQDCMPHQAYGSYERVDAWLDLKTDERRSILESAGLMFPEEQEVWFALQGKQTVEPVLY